MIIEPHRFSTLLITNCSAGDAILAPNNSSGDKSDDEEDSEATATTTATTTKSSRPALVIKGGGGKNKGERNESDPATPFNAAAAVTQVGMVFDAGK